MKVLVLWNEPTLPADHPDAVSEADVVETAEFVAHAFEARGWEVANLAVGTDPTPLINGVRAANPDLVFNLFEGTAQHGSTEHYAAGLLEWLGVPYTGARPPAMLLSRDKALCKLLLRGAGLPTADFHVVRGPDDAAGLAATATWPLFVKPAAEDASVGIDHGSGVTGPVELAARLRWLAERYPPPYLVESYLDGREFNVAIVDDPQPTVLPLAEIIFDRTQPDLWPIVSYASKWEPGSREDLVALPRCPADVEPDLAELVAQLGLAAYQLVGCRDYARVDVRTNGHGEAFVLEVNPNPDFGPGAGLARALAASGRDQAAWAVALGTRRVAERRAVIRVPR
ncbi:MAG TPA: hypothetical protein PKC45_07325 [Gemmatales bacterium]|nr:hypothetical protein [Gemmatales bacterium]